MEKQHPSARYFAICLNNEGYEASLEVGKVYRSIPDEEATKHGYLRVVDESGEDYAYSADRFFPIELPLAVEEASLSASGKFADTPLQSERCV